MSGMMVERFGGTRMAPQRAQAASPTEASRPAARVEPSRKSRDPEADYGALFLVTIVSVVGAVTLLLYAVLSLFWSELWTGLGVGFFAGFFAALILVVTLGWIADGEVRATEVREA